MSKSGIDYCDDALNPIEHGNCHCPDVGDHCYAHTMRRRFGHIWNPRPDNNGVGWYPERLKAVSTRGKPKVFFVCNTCDIGHESVATEYISWLLSGLRDINEERIMGLNLPPHKFLFLTKWPHHLYFAFLHFYSQEIANFYIGTSITGHHRATDEERLYRLAKFAKYYPLWISAEPLLGSIKDSLAMPVSIGQGEVKPFILEGCRQVIVGGETGAQARPMNPDHARLIRDMCAKAEVPYFFKSWGKHIPNGEDRRTLEGEEHKDLIWTA